MKDMRVPQTTATTSGSSQSAVVVRDAERFEDLGTTCKVLPRPTDGRPENRAMLADDRVICCADQRIWRDRG
jgi:hypothetical protein